MALSQRDEEEFKQRSAQKLKQATDPVERLRLVCLSRGAQGIKGLARCFRIYDDDGNKKLDYREFVNGLNDYGVMLSKEEMQAVFTRFDRDKSTTIDFDEFLENLRPPMSDRRKQIIGLAFGKLDKTGDGKITAADLKGVYNVKHHKKYLNGEWTEDRCLREFLDTFDSKDNKDGLITKEEFLNYYSAISASIDQDPYFDLMMRNAYGLNNL